MKKALDGICKKCGKKLKYMGYAVGNKYAEGECQRCGSWFMIPKKENDV